MLGAQFLTLYQRPDDVPEAEEERLAKRETRSHVDTVDGKQIAKLDLVRMLKGIIVQARRIGIEQRARVFGQPRVTFLRRAARIEQVICIIECRTVLPGDRAISPAAHRNHILKGEEIVLRMGDGDAIGDIGIGLAVDVRYAEFVTTYFSSVGPIGQGDIVAFGPEGLPRGQRDECCQQKHQQRKADAPQPFLHEIPSSLATGLAIPGRTRNAIGQNPAAAVSRSGFGCLTRQQ